jgi:hypothetical protein
MISCCITGLVIEPPEIYFYNIESHKRNKNSAFGSRRTAQGKGNKTRRLAQGARRRAQVACLFPISDFKPYPQIPQSAEAEFLK